MGQCAAQGVYAGLGFNPLPWPIPNTIEHSLQPAFSLGTGLPDQAIVPRDPTVAVFFYGAVVFCPPTPSPTAGDRRQRYSSQA